MLGVVDDSTLNLLGAKLHGVATAARDAGATGRSKAPGSLSMDQIQAQTASYAATPTPSLHDNKKPATPLHHAASVQASAGTPAPKKPKAADSSYFKSSDAAFSKETREQKFAREERERQAELDAAKVAVDRHNSMLRATKSAADDLASTDLSAFYKPSAKPVEKSFWSQLTGAAGEEVPKEDCDQYRAAAHQFTTSVGDGQNVDTNAHAASEFFANAPRSTWLSTAGKVLGTILLCAIGIAAGFALGAMIGGGIGALAGAPGGPFAVFTAAFGVIAGAGIGAITLGTALGMAGAGVTAAGGLVGAGFLSKFCFFSNKETPAAAGYESVPAAMHPHSA